MSCNSTQRLIQIYTLDSSHENYGKDTLAHNRLDVNSFCPVKLRKQTKTTPV